MMHTCSSGTPLMVYVNRVWAGGSVTRARLLPAHACSYRARRSTVEEVFPVKQKSEESVLTCQAFLLTVSQVLSSYTAACGRYVRKRVDLPQPKQREFVVSTLFMSV